MLSTDSGLTVQKRNRPRENRATVSPVNPGNVVQRTFAAKLAEKSAIEGVEESTDSKSTVESDIVQASTVQASPVQASPVEESAVQDGIERARQPVLPAHGFDRPDTSLDLSTLENDAAGSASFVSRQIQPIRPISTRLQEDRFSEKQSLSESLSPSDSSLPSESPLRSESDPLVNLPIQALPAERIDLETSPAPNLSQHDSFSKENPVEDPPAEDLLAQSSSQAIAETHQPLQLKAASDTRTNRSDHSETAPIRPEKIADNQEAPSSNTELVDRVVSAGNTASYELSQPSTTSAQNFLQPTIQAVSEPAEDVSDYTTTTESPTKSPIKSLTKTLKEETPAEDLDENLAESQSKSPTEASTVPSNETPNSPSTEPSTISSTETQAERQADASTELQEETVLARKATTAKPLTIIAAPDADDSASRAVAESANSSTDSLTDGSDEKPALPTLPKALKPLRTFTPLTHHSLGLKPLLPGLARSNSSFKPAGTGDFADPINVKSLSNAQPFVSSSPLKLNNSSAISSPPKSLVFARRFPDGFLARSPLKSPFKSPLEELPILNRDRPIPTPLTPTPPIPTSPLSSTLPSPLPPLAAPLTIQPYSNLNPYQHRPTISKKEAHSTASEAPSETLSNIEPLSRTPAVTTVSGEAAANATSPADLEKLANHMYQQLKQRLTSYQERHGYRHRKLG